MPDAQGTPRKPFTYTVAGLVALMRLAPGSSRAGPSPVRDIRKYLTRYVDEVEERLRDPDSLPSRPGGACYRQPRSERA